MSETIEQGARAYHHGALREALLNAAREIVRTEGVQAFTLREAARRAGVSHGAPAHHFGDKTGLLTELAVQVLEERLALIADYGARAGAEPIAQLKACGLANIDFMIANPRLDELCWRSDAIDRTHPALQAAQGKLAGDLITRMSAATGQALNPDKESNPSTLLAIAIVHGFAQLVNERMILTHVPEDERAARAHQLADEMLDFMQDLFRGLR
ncbi:MAG: TetR/AcrR family transcriptional regulator [Alphaproteobacteria bacterium]|nr:TetR/AcrR family transcriptional regulator [Alphaproteobacteria bacterium]